MTVQARHCRHCQEIFLPLAEREGGSVQCPHCTRQLIVGECEPAEVRMMPEQEYVPVMEGEELATSRMQRHDLWARRLAWCAAGVVAVVALLAWQRWGSVTEGARERTQQVAVLTEGEKAVQREHAEIEGVARRVLGAKSLDELLPEAADAPHVKELMAWYFNRFSSFQPEMLHRMESVENADVDGREIRRVCLSTLQRPVVWMVMVREEGAWKLNWELYSNAHPERWRSFLRGKPGSAVELPFLTVKKPAPDAYILRTGMTRATHDAIRLRAGESDISAAAVIPLDSPLWKSLTGIGYEDPTKENAVKIIARVTLLDPGADPPLVRLDGVVQRGWVRGTQKPVAGKAPPP